MHYLQCILSPGRLSFLYKPTLLPIFSQMFSDGPEPQRPRDPPFLEGLKSSITELGRIYSRPAAMGKWDLDYVTARRAKD